MTGPTRSDLRWSQGSLLIVTLWIITLLSVFAIAVARHLSLELRLTKYHLARERAKVLARSGVFLALSQLAQDAQDAGHPYDTLGDRWALPQDAVPVEGGQVQVTAVADEERKLDVNTATVAQLERLGLAAELAQAVVDYRDAEDPAEPRAVDPPYQPKDRAIVRLEELRDVPQLTAEAFAVLRERTSSAGAEEALPLNINTVSAEVLQSIVGETLGGLPAVSVVTALVAARPGPDGEYGTMDDCVITDLSGAAEQLAACTQLDPAAFTELLSGATFAVQSTTFRIQAEGAVDQPSVRYQVEAVVRRSSDAAEPVRVLSWMEGSSS